MTSCYRAGFLSAFAAVVRPCLQVRRRLSVVTSDFHMARSRRIFEVAAALVGEALWTDPTRCVPPELQCSCNQAVAVADHDRRPRATTITVAIPSDGCASTRWVIIGSADGSPPCLQVQALIPCRFRRGHLPARGAGCPSGAGGRVAGRLGAHSSDFRWFGRLSCLAARPASVLCCQAPGAPSHGQTLAADAMEQWPCKAG